MKWMVRNLAFANSLYSKRERANPLLPITVQEHTLAQLSLSMSQMCNGILTKCFEVFIYDRII